MADYNIGDFPYMNQENYTKKRPEPSFNPEMSESDAKTNKTVPGDGISIHDILDRAMRGMPVPPGKEVIYLDSEDIEAIDGLYTPGLTDLTDLDALGAKVADLQQRIEAAKQEQEADI